MEAELKDVILAEFETLDSANELARTPFPFHGHKDFRGFTEADYAEFSAGMFYCQETTHHFKWCGGTGMAAAAEAYLRSAGYTALVVTRGRLLNGHGTEIEFLSKNWLAAHKPILPPS